MSETPTPRTDLESYQARGPYELKEHEVVNARFARALERGLAAAKAELAELRKDKERDDIMVRNLMELSRPLWKTYLFFREERFFYPIDLPGDWSIEDNVKCNPGTIRVETVDGKVLWPTDAVVEKARDE